MSTDIRTHTGRHLNPVLPQSYDIDIRDIAHSLSLVCRWAGHTRFHYSVALHSLVVRKLLESQSVQTQLWGLLHDGTEAYIGDMAKPVKNQMPEFRRIEGRLSSAIATRFSMSQEEPSEVKDADWLALLMEAEALFDGRRDPRHFGEDEWPTTKLDDLVRDIFFPWLWLPSWLFWGCYLTPKRVEKKFLKTFNELVNLTEQI